ncbi:MAG: hemolysin family protein [bacterium]
MDWNIIALIVIIITGFFSGTFASAETALFSLPWFRVLSISRQSKRGAIVESLRSNPQRLLLDIIVGEFLLLIFISIIISSVIRGLFGDKYPLLYMFGFSIVLVIVGELIPKGLAMRMPGEVSLFLAPIINGFSRFAKPFRFVFDSVSRAVMPKGLLTESADVTVDLGKISDMVDIGIKQGFFEELEGKLIEGLLRIKETKGEEIMRRRGEVFLLSVDNTLKDAIEIIRKSGYSIIPIYENDEINIVGFVSYDDIVKHIDNYNMKVKDLLRRPIYLPEWTNAFDILEEMRSKKCQITVVIDEYGGGVGIITFEDVMDEFLKGAIRVREKRHFDVVMLGIEQFLVEGSLPLSEIENMIGVRIDSKYSKTIGGYIMELIGRIPDIGELIEIDDYEAIVMEANNMKIGRVLLRKR